MATVASSAGTGTYAIASYAPRFDDPYALGFWMRTNDIFSAITLGYVFSFADGDGNGFSVFISNSHLRFLGYASGSAYIDESSASTFAAGEWVFILIQLVSPWFIYSILRTSDQRIDQAAVHTGAADTNNMKDFIFWNSGVTNPTALATGVALAEFWFAPTNIGCKGSASALPDKSFVRTIAYRGIGSLPSQASQVKIYFDFLGKASALRPTASYQNPGASALRSRVGAGFYENFSVLEATGDLTPTSRPPIYPCFKRPKNLITRQPMIF